MKSKIANPLRALIDRIIGEKSQVSAEERQRALDASVSVMSLVAAADGAIDETEVLAVQALYADQGGGLVAASTVRRAFEIVVNDQAATWKQLESARKLDDELRESIFAAAVQAARADSELRSEESELLLRIGHALDIPAARLQSMVDAQS